jgi:RNA polymerase sigma factor (sigma-70 family)
MQRPPLITPIPRWLIGLITSHPTVRRLGLEKNDLLADIMLQLLGSREPPPLDQHRFPEGPMAYHRARWALLDTLRKHVRLLERERLVEPHLLDRRVADHRHCPEQMAAKQQIRTRIARRFRTLPKQQRMVARLRLKNGLTERQIAKRLGMSTATSHRYWAAARLQLLGALCEPNDAVT